MSARQRLMLGVIQVVGWVFIVLYGMREEVRLDWGEVGKGFAISWLGGIAALSAAKAVQRILPGYDEQEDKARTKHRREELMALEEDDIRHPLRTFLLYPGGEGFFFIPLLFGAHCIRRLWWRP